MLKIRLNGIMRRDPHTDQRGRYLIRSIYFDDIYDTAFRENADGLDRHEKFRIRAYNNDDSFISLELKIKERGKTRKISEVISRELYRYLVFDEGGHMDPGQCGDLSRKLIAAKMTRLMKPRLIVQYEREPYIMDTGNVRVTFDRFISASGSLDRMFEKNAYAFPVLPENLHLLEVKWDSFLPGHIGEALKNDNLNNTSFSKYFLSVQTLSGIKA